MPPDLTSSRARKGVVAAGHAVTAESAAEILADGGNAFDAAIAALWTACVVEPVLASPGGGGFLMAARGADRLLFDFFVDSPRAKRAPQEVEFTEILADFGTATQAFHIGLGACATPGYVPGLFAVLERLGSLPMTRLVEPAVRAAREGVVMADLQAHIASVVSPILVWTDAARAVFAPGGKLMRAGDLFYNRELGDILEAIGREGPRLASEGDLARAMLDGQCDAGYLSAEDLRAYKVEIRTPLSAGLADWTVALNAPPALGGALIARMLADIAVGGGTTPLDLARAIDRTDRHWRIAPHDIGRLAGDGAAIATTIASRGTTHVSVIDAAGNAAAATVSNGEGCGRIVPGCGFMMNNMLGEEDVNPAGFHAWHPGRRLGSMMAPTIAASQSSLVALGSGGSNRIRTAVFQVLVNRIARGLPLDLAIAAPRLHAERGHLDWEAGHGEAADAALAENFPDHLRWPGPNLFFGGVHAAEFHATGGFSGAGDARREGVCLIV